MSAPAGHGFTVLEARSPGDALLLAELLVTDVIMPGMSGRELAARNRLLRSRPGLKVLYLSGYSDEILDQRGGLGRGTAFLPKPYSPATLARKLFETLRLQQWLCPSISCWCANSHDRRQQLGSARRRAWGENASHNLIDD